MRLSLTTRSTRSTRSARPDRPDEDFIGTTSDVVVLLDGAGTPAGPKTGCSHGVAWYARTLGSTLLAAVTQSAGPLAEILSESIRNAATARPPRPGRSRRTDPPCPRARTQRSGRLPPASGQDP